MEIIVETERLILRELIPSDEEGMFELDKDPEVHRYLGNQPVISIAQSREMISFIRQQYIKNGIGRWAVIEKHSNNFIGWAGLKLITTTINNHCNYHDLGYRLIKKYWGKGLATEAATASVNYGVNQLKLTEIYGMADVNNLASKNVLEKSGLQYIEKFYLDGVQHNWFKLNYQK